jgi:hypothetical protein
VERYASTDRTVVEGKESNVPTGRAFPIRATRMLCQPDSLGLAVALGAIFLYMISIYNCAIPITEGWFHYYGMLMNNGEVPYRDFYVHTPPVNLLISQGILLLSHKFITFRYYGMIERLLTVVAFYWVLRANFSITAAVIGTISCMFTLQTSRLDFLYGYLQTCLFFTAFALLFLQRAYLKARGSSLFVFLAGAAASLSFFSKQSSGLFITIICVCTILLAASQWSTRVRHASLFVLGWTVPAAALVAWLSYLGALNPFIDCVFGGVSSKGGTSDILTGFISRMLSTITTRQWFLVAVAWFGALRGTMWSVATGPSNDSHPKRNVLVIASIVSASLAVSYYYPRVDDKIYYISNYLPQFIATLVTLFLVVAGVSFALVAVRFVDLLSGRPAPFNPLLIVTVFCASWAYSCGISYMIDEAAGVLVVGVALALLYDRAGGALAPLLRGLVMFAMCLIVLMGSSIRYYEPWTWWGWKEPPISQCEKSSKLRQLRGLRMSADTLNVYEGIIRRILEHSQPGDRIYTFPHIPIFNYLTRRKQVTYAPVAYFDTCPDFVARADAERLRAHPPKVFVYLEFPEAVWEIHETAFRGGRRSGQRDIRDVLESFMNNPDYEKLDSYITPGYNYPLSVWARRDRIALRPGDKAGFSKGPD